MRLIDAGLAPSVVDKLERNSPIPPRQSVDKISQYLVVSHWMLSVMTGRWNRFLLHNGPSRSRDHIGAAVEAPFHLVDRHLLSSFLVKK